MWSTRGGWPRRRGGPVASVGAAGLSCRASAALAASTQRQIVAAVTAVVGFPDGYLLSPVELRTGGWRRRARLLCVRMFFRIRDARWCCCVVSVPSVSCVFALFPLEARRGVVGCHFLIVWAIAIALFLVGCSSSSLVYIGEPARNPFSVILLVVYLLVLPSESLYSSW